MDLSLASSSSSVSMICCCGTRYTLRDTIDCCTLRTFWLFLSGGLMTILDTVLILFIATSAARFTIYDQFIAHLWHFPSLAISLLRRAVASMAFFLFVS